MSRVGRGWGRQRDASAIAAFVDAIWPKNGARPGDSGCVHHWLLQSPNGPTVRGICKLCGATKEFRTAADNLDDELERDLRKRATNAIHAATYRRRGLKARWRANGHPWKGSIREAG